MTRLLKQSTAFTFRMGPFIDSSDGNTEETSLSIAAAEIKLSKNGTAFAIKNDSTAPSHDVNSWYTCVLDTVDTNTLGMLTIYCHPSGALPVWHDFTILASNIYDSLISNTDILDVTTIINSDKTGYSLTVSPPTANQIADQVWDEVLAGHLTAGTTGEALDNAGGSSSVTAENIWAYPSRTITGADVSGATLSEALEGTTLNIRRGDSTSITFTGLGVLTGYTSLWFTIKPSIKRDDADSEAIVQIKKNASGSGDGLLYFNSAAAPDPTLGYITVDDASAGIVTIVIDKSVTAQFAPVQNKPYDVQMLLSSGISTLTDGKANIYGDVTRSLS